MRSGSWLSQGAFLKVQQCQIDVNLQQNAGTELTDQYNDLMALSES